MIREKLRFYVERDDFGVEACIMLMALSAVFRIIGCWGLWNDHSYALTQIALPVVTALMMIVFVWLFGKRLLWMTFIPVTLGAVFFIIKAFGFESRVHMMLCILLYIAVIALYFCTVFSIIRTKWILVALFGLPFLYHIFVEDLPALQNTEQPVTFAAGMQEMGVLCIMLGLFFLSLSMRKQVTVTEAKHPKGKPAVAAETEEIANTEAAAAEAQTGDSTVTQTPEESSPPETEMEA